MMNSSWMRCIYLICCLFIFVVYSQSEGRIISLMTTEIFFSKVTQLLTMTKHLIIVIRDNYYIIQCMLISIPDGTQRRRMGHGWLLTCWRSVAKGLAAQGSGVRCSGVRWSNTPSTNCSPTPGTVSGWLPSMNTVPGECVCVCTLAYACLCVHAVYIWVCIRACTVEKLVMIMILFMHSHLRPIHTSISP